MENKHKRKHYEQFQLDRSEKSFKFIIGPILYFLSLIPTGFSDLACTSRMFSLGLSPRFLEKVGIWLEKNSYK